MDDAQREVHRQHSKPLRRIWLRMTGALLVTATLILGGFTYLRSTESVWLDWRTPGLRPVLARPDAPRTLALPVVLNKAVPRAEATVTLPVQADPVVPSPAPVLGYTVVHTYPHDAKAFTQGLVYTDSLLYEGTGLYGHSSLRRVDPETGDIYQHVSLDSRYFGEGIVVYEDRIYQLTWRARTGFVYDRATLTQLDTFQYATEGWGFTHDGHHLIMSDGSDKLYFWDPETLQEVQRIVVRDGEEPVTRLNELEYIKGVIWANVWQTDRIAQIDPDTGYVTAWVDLTGILPASERTGSEDVLNGIAYDAEGDRIFVTGKLWPLLFEIRTVALDK